MTTLPRNKIHALGRGECLQRLERGGIGRMAFLDGPRLTVLPVNFVLVGSDVVIRTSTDGALYGAAVAGADAAFEVDELDPGYRAGRSVLARGPLHVAPDPGRAAAALHPWGNSSADAWVAMTPDEVTGKRIRAPEI